LFFVRISSMKKIIQYNNKNTSSISLTDCFNLSKKQVKNIHLFFCGFLIYTIGYAFTNIGEKQISIDVFQGIQLVGLIVLIIGAVDLMKFKFDDAYLQSVFTIYIVFSATVIVRVGDMDYVFIKTLLFNVDYSVFLYLVPLVIFFPRNIAFYKNVFKFIFLFGIAFLIFSIVYSNVILDPTRADNSQGQYAIECFFLYLCYPTAFVLLTYIYHTQPKKLFAFGIFLLCTYFLIFRARRGSLFVCLTTMTGVLMMYLIHTKRTVMIIFLSIFLVLFCTLFLSNIKPPAFMDFLLSRADTDTRTGVELCMKADMTWQDWIIGKGIHGKYICPLGVDEETALTGQRSIIETGYLQIILGSGLLGIGLVAFMIIPAIYKGLFKSSNLLCKAAGIFMLLWVIYQYPRIVTSFSLYYIMVWICVGMCYSPTIRNMSDSVIKMQLQKK